MVTLIFKYRFDTSTEHSNPLQKACSLPFLNKLQVVASERCAVFIPKDVTMNKTTFNLPQLRRKPGSHSTVCTTIEAGELFITDFCSAQVKMRFKEFLEKMLQQIGAEHFSERGQDDSSLPAPSQTTPTEGKADDGVKDIPVHALVVTHGAYMCVVVRYFVEELHCRLPLGSDQAHVFSLSPNTGLCRFIITVRKQDDEFILSGIRCVFIHRGDHVKRRS